MKTLLLLVLSMVAAARDATAQEDAQCVRERAAMVETIRDYARSHAGVLGQQGLSERVLEAMGQTKRHLFIPERSCSIAYADRPIPIGLGQTISQPFIVALMTQLAEVAPDHVVLEVGTGSGYQAAILAHLARKVCTIEIIPQLAEAAAKTLRDLAYDNVSVRLGDGYGGWPECGPFDAIVVTAALGQVPPPLIEQLKVGGSARHAGGSRATALSTSRSSKKSPLARRQRAPSPPCALCPLRVHRAGSAVARMKRSAIRGPSLRIKPRISLAPSGLRKITPQAPPSPCRWPFRNPSGRRISRAARRSPCPCPSCRRRRSRRSRPISRPSSRPPTSAWAGRPR